MSKKATGAQFRRARAEIVEMLGFDGDPDALPVAQSMRLDAVLALKIALDEMRAKLFAGEPVDHGKMLSLSEAIERYLPAQAKPDPTPALFKQDPHRVMNSLITRFFAAKRASEAEEAAERLAKGLPAQPPDYESALSEIEALRVELGELRGMLPAADPTTALPAPERVIDPPTGDIVGPREQSDNAANMRAPVGPNNPKPPATIDAEGKPLRPGSQMLPDGRIVPIPPTARSGAEGEAQRLRSNADRATAHRVMNEPGIKGAPQPSTDRIMGGIYEGPFRRVW